MSTPNQADSDLSKPLSVVLAGGGSAGHTSPLIATAEELRALVPGVRLTAVGTARGLENQVIPAAGLPLQLIPPVPMPRKPSPDLLKLPMRLRRAINESAAILDEVGADVVLGFGGYVSTPVYLAARKRKIPVVIHEQNVLPGLANKIAARFARVVAVSFADTPLPRAQPIGLPLRAAITQLDRPAVRAEARATFGLHPDLPTLLVSGGSQGAQQINRAVLGARDFLLEQGIQILHALGPKNASDDIVQVTHPETGAVYQPLTYVDRMELAYAAADLMLGRGGASTVMETAVVGLPTIFVPYPHFNGEQARNVTQVVEVGGGILLADADCSPEWLIDQLPGLISDQDRLAGMSKATRSVAQAEAARKLAEMTVEVAR